MKASRRVGVWVQRQESRPDEERLLRTAEAITRNQLRLLESEAAVALRVEEFRQMLSRRLQSVWLNIETIDHVLSSIRSMDDLYLLKGVVERERKRLRDEQIARQEKGRAEHKANEKRAAEKRAYKEQRLAAARLAKILRPAIGDTE